MLLLNPGPVTLSERVRRSLLQPDLCHRESEFFALQDEARRGLPGGYGLDPEVWTAILDTLCRDRGLQHQRNTPFTPAVHAYYALVEALRELAGLKANGFVIYAGQGDLARSLFRISTMGCVTAADLDRLLRCCAELL